MSNKYFPDEQITFNDLYFVCYMIERVARRLRQHNCYVVSCLSDEGLMHELSIAETNHCINPEQVESEWIDHYHMSQGNFDVTGVVPKFTDRYPSVTQMGKVYARLVHSVDTEDNLASAIQNVYNSPICDTIDDYNTGAYYEPSYIQTRAFFDDDF